MRIVRGIHWIAGLALLASCDDAAGPTQGQGPAGGKADEARLCPEAPVTYADPGDDASVQQRQAALQGYADELKWAKTCELDAHFAEQDLTSVEPLDDYIVQVGPDGCLPSLDSDRKHDQVDRQIESTVQFLADFHEDMNGRRSSSFDTVQICDKAHKGGDLVLDPDAGVLTVGVSFSLLGQDSIGMAPKTGQRIRQWWDAGAHLDHLDFIKAWNDEFWFDGTDDLWRALDPVGEARHGLRVEIQAETDMVRQSLAELTAADTLALGDLMKAHVREGEVFSGRDVRACGLGFLAHATAAQVGELTDLWSSAMHKPAAWDALTEALLIASQPPTKIPDRSVVKACGPTDLGDIELIHIDVRGFMGPYAEVMEHYLTVTQGQTEYQSGTASCHFGIEDVDTVVSAQRALPTAALDHALSELEVDCAAVQTPPTTDDGGGDDDADTGSDGDSGDPTGDDPTGDDPTGDDPTGGDPTGGDTGDDPRPPGDSDDPDPTDGDPTDGDPTDGGTGGEDPGDGTGGETPDDPAGDGEDPPSDPDDDDDEDPYDPSGGDDDEDPYNPFDEDEDEDDDDSSYTGSSPWGGDGDTDGADASRSDPEGCHVAGSRPAGRVAALGLLLLGLRRRRLNAVHFGK